MPSRPGMLQPRGQLQPGNIDLYNRPRVKNPDGTTSTVRSMSANFDGKEVLIPTVSDDGRIMPDEEAIESYRKSGKHLGTFSDPESATSYAEKLHEDYAAGRYDKAPSVTEPTVKPEGVSTPAVSPPVGVGGPAPVGPLKPPTGVGTSAPAPLRPKGPLPGTVVPLSVEAAPISAPKPPPVRPGTTVPMDVFSRATPPPGTMPGMNIPDVRQPGPLVTSSPYGAAAGRAAEALYRSVAGANTIPGKMSELITRGGFKQQEAMQTPLVDLSQFAPEDAPLIQGVAESLASFTSPESVMMLAGTGALGRLAKGPFGRAVSLGFTVDMLDELPEQGAEFRKAIAEQRLDDAERILGAMMVQGGMAGLAGGHAAFGGNPPRYRKGMIPELVERMRPARTGEILPVEQPVEVPQARRRLGEGEPINVEEPRVNVEAEPIRPQPFEEPAVYVPRPTLEPEVISEKANLQQLRQARQEPEPTVLPELPRKETAQLEEITQAGRPEPVVPRLPREGREPPVEIEPTAVGEPIEKTWIPGHRGRLKPAEPYVEKLIQEKEAAEEQRDTARRELEVDERTGYGSAAALKRALPTAELDPETEIASLDLANLKARNDLDSPTAGDIEIKAAADAVAQSSKELGLPPRVFTPKGDEVYAIGPKGSMAELVERARAIYGERPIGDSQYSNYLRGGAGGTLAEADAAMSVQKAGEKGAKFRQVSQEVPATQEAEPILQPEAPTEVKAEPTVAVDEKKTLVQRLKAKYQELRQKYGNIPREDVPVDWDDLHRKTMEEIRQTGEKAIAELEAKHAEVVKALLGDPNLPPAEEAKIRLKYPDLSTEQLQKAAEPTVTPEAKPEEPKVTMEDVAKGMAEPTIEVTPTPSGDVNISVQTPKVKTTLKEQKTYLLAEIDKALEEVPEKYDANKAKVVIEVPGDGQFSVYNDKKALAEFQKRVSSKFPTNEGTKSSKPSLRMAPSNKRMTGEGVEYYNPYRVRKADLFPGAVDFSKGREINRNYEHEGWFSTGPYAILAPPPKGVKAVPEPKLGVLVKDIPKDLMEGKVTGEFYYNPAAEAPKPSVSYQPGYKPPTEEEPAEPYQPGMRDPLAHVTAPDGRESFLDPDYVDMVLTKYPNAKPFISPKSSAAVYFKDEGKLVALVMPINLKGIPPSLRARAEEVATGQLPDVGKRLIEKYIRSETGMKPGDEEPAVQGEIFAGEKAEPRVEYPHEQAKKPGEVSEGEGSEGPPDLRQSEAIVREQLDRIEEAAASRHVSAPTYLVTVTAHFHNGQKRSKKVRSMAEAVRWAQSQENSSRRLTELRSSPTPNFRHGGILAYRDTAKQWHTVADDARLGKLHSAAQSTRSGEGEEPSKSVREDEEPYGGIFRDKERGAISLGFLIGKSKRRTVDLNGIASPPRQREPLVKRAGDFADNAWNNFLRRHYDQFIYVKRLVEAQHGKKGAMDLSADEDPYKKLRIAFGGVGGKAELAFMDYGQVTRDASKAGLDAELTEYLRLKGKDRAISVVEEKLADRKQRIPELRAQRQTLDRQIRHLEKEKGQFGVREATRLEALKDKRLRVLQELKTKSMEASRFTAELADKTVVPDMDDHASIATKLHLLESRMKPEDWQTMEGYGKGIFDLNRNAWDLAERAGLISDALHKKGIGRGNEYVTMSRVSEDIPRAEGVEGPGFSAKQVVKPLEGSERELVDPIDASMQMHQAIIKEAEKSLVVRELVDWMQNAGSKVSFIRPLFGEDKPGVGKDVISHWEKGMLRRFEVDQVIADTVNLADARLADFAGKTLINFLTNVARGGITAFNTAFAVPNVTRDLRTMALLSKAGVKNPIQEPLDSMKLMREWVKALATQNAKDPSFRAFLNSGAAFSTMQSAIDPGAFTGRSQRGLTEMLKRYTGLEAAGKLNNLLEQATKLATFKRAKQMGMSDLDAAWETRNFGGSPDFGSKGTQSALTGLVSLFLNARVQGTGQNVKGAWRDPKRVAAVLAALTAAAAAIQAWNNRFQNPDDQKLEWEHVTDPDKNNYTIIFRPETYQTSAGATRYRQIRIPKSHFEQLFMNPIQNAIGGLMGGKFDPAQTGLDVAANLLPVGGDIRKGSVAKDIVFGVGSSLNPVAKEILEQAANRDLYRDVPIVPRGLEDLDPEYQFRATTSELAKRVGAKTGVSPLRLEHVRRTFTGGVGETATSVTDRLLGSEKKRTLEGDEGLGQTILLGPILRRFVGSSSDEVMRQKSQAFYDNLGRAGQAHSTLNMLAKSNREEAKRYIEDPERRALVKARPAYTEGSGLLKQLRDETRRVGQDETLSPDGRRQRVKKLYLKQVKIYDLVNQALEKARAVGSSGREPEVQVERQSRRGTAVPREPQVQPGR